MKIRDIIVIVGILVAAVGAFLFVELTKEAGAEVVVKIDGEEVVRYSLAIDGEYELNNGTNILCISDGKAYLIDATCPDHLCIQFGKIYREGETITCLPNKLTITVVGGEQPNVDLVS